MYKLLTTTQVLKKRRKERKENSIGSPLVLSDGQEISIVFCACEAKKAGLALSPGLLICAAHLSSAGALKFPLTHRGAASHTQHKGKEESEGGRGREGKPADSHLQQTPPSHLPPRSPQAVSACQSSHR